MYLLDGEDEALLAEVSVDGGDEDGLREGRVGDLKPLGARAAEDADVGLVGHRTGHRDEARADVEDVAHKVAIRLPLVLCGWR